MNRFIIPVFIGGLWLAAWATDTALLVNSAVERGAYDGRVRACYYFVGVTVERRVRGEAWRYARCPLLARLRF